MLFWQILAKLEFWLFVDNLKHFIFWSHFLVNLVFLAIAKFKCPYLKKEEPCRKLCQGRFGNLYYFTGKISISLTVPEAWLGDKVRQTVFILLTQWKKLSLILLGNFAVLKISFIRLIQNVKYRSPSLSWKVETFWKFVGFQQQLSPCRKTL